MKKKELIVVGVICGLFLFIGIIISIFDRRESNNNQNNMNINGNNNQNVNTSTNLNTNTNSNTNTSTNTENISKEDKIAFDVIKIRNQNKTTTFNAYTKVNNYDDFYNAEAMILKYYGYYNYNDSVKLMNVLDKSFVNKNGVSTSNVISKINSNNKTYSFELEELYEISNVNIVYYFAKGISKKTDNLGESVDFVKSNNFLITYDFNTLAFTVFPLGEDIDILSYTKSFVPKNIGIDVNYYNKYYYSKEDRGYVFSRYIAYFKDLIFVNSQKAYTLLYDDAKNKYGSFESFDSEGKYDIYNNIDENVRSYKYMKKENREYYIVLSYSRKQTIIYEKGFFNFQISFII